MNISYKELAKSGLDLDGLLSMRQLFRFLELHPEEVLPTDYYKLSEEKLISQVFGKLFCWTGDVLNEAISGEFIVDKLEVKSKNE